MIFLVFPCNYITGWGVCATNLAKELSQKTNIKYVSTELNILHKNQSLIESTFFASCQFNDYEFLKNQKDYPVIEAVHHDFSNYITEISGSPKIAICFSDRKIPFHLVKKAKTYDVVVSGSSWCHNLLADHGINSQVIIQGVDPDLFNLSRQNKKVWKNDFLVFMGGKFEHRKGQDVALKAYKIFQDKYPEAKLVCCWENPYTNENGETELHKAGIDLRRVILLPNLPNDCMPNIYQNTDVGIFASRCEAGTNLVLMEYMACGKPAIATIGTGQKDLINTNTGIPLNYDGTCHLYDNNQIVSIWEEPNYEDILSKLEWAYYNLDACKKIGTNAANLMKNYTWEIMANKIYNLISEPPSAF